MARHVMPGPPYLEGFCTIWSTTESGDLQNEILDGHGDRTKALHSFGDMKDRLFPSDLRALNAIVSHHKDAYDEHTSWHREGTITDEEYTRHVRLLQKSAFREL
eukprot:2016625-Pyramimonas_sp.AAC.1